MVLIIMADWRSACFKSGVVFVMMVGIVMMLEQSADKETLIHHVSIVTQNQDLTHTSVFYEVLEI